MDPSGRRTRRINAVEDDADKDDEDGDDESLVHSADKSRKVMQKYCLLNGIRINNINGIVAWVCRCCCRCWLDMVGRSAVVYCHPRLHDGSWSLRYPDGARTKMEARHVDFLVTKISQFKLLNSNFKTLS